MRWQRVPGIFYHAAIVAVLAAGCTSAPDKRQETTGNVPATAVSTISYSPVRGLTSSDSVAVSITTTAGGPTLDSASVGHSGGKIKVFPSPDFTVSLRQVPLGRQTLSVVAYLSNGKTEHHSLQVTILAPRQPRQYSFVKVATLTHDPDAYTQGLLFKDGVFFESTGTRGESTLRKTDVSTGKVLQQINLDDSFFGEGLALWENTLIQLTWTSHTAFVYDIETFAQKGTFAYPTEGWGLTTLGNDLVMSDGSENLYFLDPYSFAEKRRIQVYDHEGPIRNLNELEAVDGLIYANVYQTDDIVIIHPESGTVEGRIDLQGIFNQQGYNRRLDVLNGIAWDEKGRRLFVTGKWWPKLYQIELTETGT